MTTIRLWGASVLLGSAMFATGLLLLTISGCNCAVAGCTGKCPTLGDGVTCNFAAATCGGGPANAPCGCVQILQGPLDGPRVNAACACQ